jgi:hypothetical protein
MGKRIAKPKLAPCPFCGSPGKLMSGMEGGRPPFYVTCSDSECGACLGADWTFDWAPLHDFKTAEEAAKAWNTRHG